VGGSCSTIWEKRIAYRLLLGKSDGKRPLGRPRLKWLDNIWMDVVEMGFGDVDWAYSTSGEKRNAYRLLVGKSEERRPLGRLDNCPSLSLLIYCQIYPVLRIVLQSHY
jgi:hypothetical protein